MPRPFEKTTPVGAVGRLRPGMKVLLQPGCADPTALLREIMRQADRLAPLDEVERRAKARGNATEPGTQLGDWITWASRHADRLDPFTPPFPEESDERAGETASSVS